MKHMKRALGVLAALALASSLAACSGKSARVEATAGPDIQVTSSKLPQGSWQAEVSFPDWAGYTDDTLALNSMYSFKDYHGQGTIYVSVADGVSDFNLSINNHAIDTSSMEAGGTYAVDISNIARDGTNNLMVTGIEPHDTESAITVHVPYPTVLDGSLEDAGISQDAVDAISDIVQADIDEGFTSAQIAIVKDGRLVYQNAWGKLVSYSQDGTSKTDSADVTNDTLYDLASNTKMYSVNYALQYLVANEGFDLDQKISDIIGPEFMDDTIDIAYDGYEDPGLDTVKQWKSELTVRDILRHQAGFPADPQYHNDRFNQVTQKPDPDTANVLYSGSDGTEATREKTLESICMTPLMYEPGTKTVYSDVDYMLLGFIIEKTTGEDLNTFLKETFWNPMGLSHITYQPLEHGFAKDDCAATELNGNTRDGAISFTDVRTGTIQGEVHDEKAYYAMAGVSGHAGLFANATDLAKLASVMLTGGYGTNSYFSHDVIDTFTAPKKEDDTSAKWGLGWWREGDMQRAWYFGTESSSNTIGHQGWTGTLTMIDPSQDLVIVYLTNKIDSPVTDPEANHNTFDGNWYTSSTLGFVPQLVEMGMDTGGQDLSCTYTQLLSEMAHDKFRLVATEEETQGHVLASDHALVKAAYATVEVLFDRAERTGAQSDWDAAKNAMALLDERRDATKISELKGRLPN